MGRPATCACGTCKKCKHAAYMRDYYRRNAERGREIAKASRDRRLEEVRAYDRKRGVRIYDVAKVRSRATLQAALQKGLVKRQPCEVCGEAKTDGHHDDHEKPLEVRWLCRKHHMELHRRF